MKTTAQIIEYLYPGAVKKQLGYFDLIKVKKIVSNIMEVPYKDFDKDTRKTEIVRCHQVTMTILKIFTHSSLAEIGIEITGKDHATVLHAIKTVANLHETDRNFRYKFERAVYAVERFVNKSRAVRPMKKPQWLLKKEFWKYAITLLSTPIEQPKIITLTSNQYRKLRSLEESVKDKDRQIRLLKAEIDRSKIKNFNEYID